MLYTCSSIFGEFRLVREGVLWHVEFNTVRIGGEHPSAEQALSCLVRGAGYMADVADLVAAAGLPSSLRTWQHVAPPSHDREPSRAIE